MTNPDLPAAVDLTLYEPNENDLVDAAIASIRVRMPEWVPQEGHTEVLLIEAMALLIGQEVWALNRLPYVVMDALMAMDGLDRQPAVAGTAQLRITLTSTTGPTVNLPAGSRFRVRVDTAQSFDVLSVESVSITPANGLTTTVWVRADEPGARWNGTPAGSPADVLDPLPWADRAELASPLLGGADPESDADFYARGVAYRRRQTPTLVTADQFSGAALDVAGVSRARAVSAYDPARPQSEAGTNLGHVTVAVAGEDGAAVLPAVKAQVQQVLTGLSLAGLTIHVVDRTAQAVTVHADVTAEPTVSDLTALEADVKDALTAWLDPDGWDWGADIWTYQDVIMHAGRVPGVRRVTNATGTADPSGLFTLPAKPPTITVTARR